MMMMSTSAGRYGKNEPVIRKLSSEKKHPPIAEAISDDDNDFLKRFYDNAVDGSCQIPGICQGHSVDDYDLFMQCRQPLSVFALFRERDSQGLTSGGVVVGTTGSGEVTGVVEVLPAGAYVLPKFCEYCNAPALKHCGTGKFAHCNRPPLYFQKKRPPFAKKDSNRWDPLTDDSLVACKKNTHSKDEQSLRNIDNSILASAASDSSMRKQSWMGMFSSNSSSKE